MGASFIDKTTELRDGAWREVQTSSSFLAFKALDDAVAAMGGKRLIANAAPREDGPRPSVGTFERSNRNRTVSRRISQSDAAEAALKARGNPLPVGRLLEAALEKGATIGGENPLANFRSTLSKDPRFYSFKRNNMYFWWVNTVSLPEDWREAPDPDLLTGPDASFPDSNQEGGDGHAATMPS